MAHHGRPWRDYKPPPAASVWSVIQAGNTYWMLVAAIELGIFDALEEKPKQTAEVLAKKNYRFQHPIYNTCLIPWLPLDFLINYRTIMKLTETAERYLCRNGVASMAYLVRVSPGPLQNWTGLAETIRKWSG